MSNHCKFLRQIAIAKSQLNLRHVLTLLLLLFVFFAKAQHLEFKGLQMCGSVSSFAQKLEEQGYKTVYNNGFNYALSGQFTGKDAKVLLLGSVKTGEIWKIAVIFDKSLTWSDILSDYSTYVDLFTKKYGFPSDHFEFFEKPYYKGDGYELQALRNGKCNYVSFFKTNEGTITVEMSRDERLRLTYEDKINVELQNKEKTSRDLDDI